jgi:peptidoglycan/xylan/chitin deacetylase (PgdA/CDA1 family)/thymidylate kinase
MTVTILVYHRVVDGPPQSFHDVARTEFTAQLDLLKKLDAQGPGPVLRLKDGTGVVLSFDDGTADHAWVATQLAGRGWRGVFLISPMLLDQPGRLSSAELTAMAAAGHEIGAHGLTHDRLDRMAQQQVQENLLQAQQWLAGICDRPIRWFAPPGGLYAASLPTLLAAAGFVRMRSMAWGKAREPLIGPLPAVPVTARTGVAGLARLLRRSHLSLRLAYHAKQSIRGLVGEDGADRLREMLGGARSGISETPASPAVAAALHDRHALFFHILREVMAANLPLAIIDGLAAYPRLAGGDGDLAVAVRPWRDWLDCIDRTVAGTGWHRLTTIRRGHLMMIFLARADAAPDNADHFLQLDMHRAFSTRGLAFAATAPLLVRAEQHHGLLWLKAGDAADIRQGERRGWSPGDLVDALMRHPRLVLQVAVWKSTDAIGRYLRPPGSLWAISGPDGAGKTTLIAALQPLLTRRLYRGVRTFHTRPFLLGGRKDPGGSRPVLRRNGRLVSLLRLAVAWLDYSLGYWLVVRPALAGGDAVLFDRHALDYLIDPAVRGISLPSWLVYLLRCTPQPDGQVVVVAPAAVLAKRKNELTPDEAERQIQAYRDAAAAGDIILIDSDCAPADAAARDLAATMRTHQEQRCGS